MPMILTDGKKKWVAKRKPQQVKGKPLNPSAAAEWRYYRELSRLITTMSRETKRQVEKLYAQPYAEAYFAEDVSISSQARIILNSLAEKFDEIFNIASKPLAEKVAKDASRTSAAALQSSLKQLSGGLTLKTDVISGDIAETLMATINENVSLIKSIPSEYHTQIQGAVMRSITTGRGLADLVPFIQNYEGVTLRRARIIARDQTRKAFSNLNFDRMKRIGVQEYEWLHSAGGQQPRRLHQRMSGNIYRMDDPPIIDEKTGQRGKPGDLINCRCRAIPVIKFNEG